MCRRDSAARTHALRELDALTLLRKEHHDGVLSGVAVARRVIHTTNLRIRLSSTSVRGVLLSSMRPSGLEFGVLSEHGAVVGSRRPPLVVDGLVYLVEGVVRTDKPPHEQKELLIAIIEKACSLRCWRPHLDTTRPSRSWF